MGKSHSYIIRCTRRHRQGVGNVKHSQNGKVGISKRINFYHYCKVKILNGKSKVFHKKNFHKNKFNYGKKLILLTKNCLILEIKNILQLNHRKKMCNQSKNVKKFKYFIMEKNDYKIFVHRKKIDCITVFNYKMKFENIFIMV